MTPPQAQINTESNRQYINTQSQFNSTIEATIQSCLASWSGRCYLSACHRARSAVNDRTTEYGEPESFEEHQNQSKGKNIKNSNDTKRT
jgi:hypothetical protein